MCDYFTRFKVLLNEARASLNRTLVYILRRHSTTRVINPNRSLRTWKYDLFYLLIHWVYGVVMHRVCDVRDDLGLFHTCYIIIDACVSKWFGERKASFRYWTRCQYLLITLIIFTRRCNLVIRESWNDSFHIRLLSWYTYVSLLFGHLIEFFRAMIYVSFVLKNYKVLLSHVRLSH